MKRAVLLLLCCGCESAPLPDDFDSTLPPVADDSCARFAFRFELDGCPEPACDVPVCSCPDPIPCLSGLHGRCAVGMSCEAACAADPTTLFVCASEIEPCSSDGECAGGLRVSEPGRSLGECESGERGARCRNDQDCMVGNCVAGLNGNRACSPGEPFDLCNRDQDCGSGRCSQGECQ